MDYSRKIQSKDELFNEDGTLITQNLKNLDISDIDLSDVDPSVWEHARFYNTNFKNTGIKFYPRKLVPSAWFDFYPLDYCNFENCDLSYLKDEDLKEVTLEGVNLRNTNLNINFRNNKVFALSYNPYFTISEQSDEERVKLINGAILPDTYNDVDIHYFDYADLDLEFIDNNPKIKISSGKLFEILRYYFLKKFKIENEISDQEFEEYKKIFIKYLEHDEEGLLKKFYNQIKPYLESKKDYLNFFQGRIINKNFDEGLDLSYFDKKLLSQVLFDKCTISKLKINVSYKELNKEMSKCYYVGFLRNTPVYELSMPIDIHSWQNAGKRRMFQSNITMQTNLYLEFERICNMCCEFCRNEGLEESEFNFAKQIKKVKSIFNHLNSIVVGGGEPTLYIDELKKLSRELKKFKRRVKIFIITNGSANYDLYEDLILSYNYRFYFSRHAIEDMDNRQIFHDTNKQILTTDELTNISKRDEQVMCCTCFKGGVDKVSKILDYIKYVEYIGYKKVLFQNLHLEDEFNKSININDTEMLEAIEKLKEKGFRVIRPIISNSNYILYLLKKDGFNISFKIYKDQKEIYDLWNKSSKRCFDLSIDPAGIIHETWKDTNDTNMLKLKNQP